MLPYPPDAARLSGCPEGSFQINKASLSGRSLNTEIFSKRRKIYSDLFRELEMIAVPWQISPKDVLSRRGVFGAGLPALFVRLSLCHEWGVSRSWRYCNARSTRDEAGASSWTSSPCKIQFNIEGDTWSPYQILSLQEQILHFDLSQKAEKRWSSIQWTNDSTS